MLDTTCTLCSMVLNVISIPFFPMKKEKYQRVLYRAFRKLFLYALQPMYFQTEGITAKMQVDKSIIQQFVELVKKKNEIKLEDATAALDVDQETVVKLAEILKDQEIIDIHYTIVGETIFKPGPRIDTDVGEGMGVGEAAGAGEGTHESIIDLMHKRVIERRMAAAQEAEKPVKPAEKPTPPAEPAPSGEPAPPSKASSTDVQLTELSAEGQILIPDNIREEMGLSAGTPLVVVRRGDMIILKKVKLPTPEELDRLVSK
jgi:AbrB family looped-hinge helix DNA binding protein